MADDDGPLPSTFVGNGAAQPAGRLGVVLPRLGGAIARGVRAGIDSLRRHWDLVSPPPGDSAAPPPGSMVHRILWLIAHSTLLLLIGLVFLALGPGYAIVSDGIARRWQDEHAIVVFVLRVLNPPFALALLVGAFYASGRVIGVLLGLDRERVGRVRALTAKFLRFLLRSLLVVGILEVFPWLAQKVFPSELARALLGILLILVGASSGFRFPPRTRKDVIFMIGLAVSVEGVASLLWDSGWVWQGWGARLAKAAVLAAVVMVWRRWRRDKNGGFGSSAQTLGEAVERAGSFALAIRAMRGRPLGPLDPAQGEARHAPRPAESPLSKD